MTNGRHNRRKSSQKDFEDLFWTFLKKRLMKFFGWMGTRLTELATITVGTLLALSIYDLISQL
jgi:hypothetical protein